MFSRWDAWIVPVMCEQGKGGVPQTHPGKCALKSCAQNLFSVHEALIAVSFLVSVLAELCALYQAWCQRVSTAL